MKQLFYALLAQRRREVGGGGGEVIERGGGKGEGGVFAPSFLCQCARLCVWAEECTADVTQTYRVANPDAEGITRMPLASGHAGRVR